ncbi:hypothetical protein [Streptomyces hebeiensis]
MKKNEFRERFDVEVQTAFELRGDENPETQVVDNEGNILDIKEIKYDIRTGSILFIAD